MQSDKMERAKEAAPDAEGCRSVSAGIESRLGQALAAAGNFRQALDYLPVQVYIKDLKHHYAYANRSALELFGSSAQDIIGSDGHRHLPAEAMAQLLESESRVLAGEASSEELEIVDASGRQRYFWDVKAPIRDDTGEHAILGLVGVATDITACKELEAKLEWQSQSDLLTELPNRTFFLKIAEMEISRARRYRSPLTIALVRLDRLGLINETLGRAAGDKTLREVARACRQSLRDSDLLARMGAHDFAMLLPETSLEQAQVVAGRLRKTLADAGLEVPRDARVPFAASVGLAALAESDDSVDSILVRADTAVREDRRSTEAAGCASVSM